MGWGSIIGTIGGALLGFFVAGPTGAAIGASLGSYVGSQFDPKADRPPTIDEVKAQGASEGDGMQYWIGREAPVTGEIVHRGPLIKKEPGVQKPGHDTLYFLPIVISFGRPITGLPAQKLVELRANGDTIYWAYDEVSITGTDIAATLVEVSSYDAGTGTTTVIQRYLDLTSSVTSLSGLIAGRAVAVAGFVAAGNNGTFTVLTSASTSARLVDGANALHLFVTEAAGASVSLLQAADEQWIWHMFTPIEVGLGTVDQAPPALMTYWQGAGAVPGMSGLTWVAVEQFPLNPYGIAVPRFEATWRDRIDTDLPIAIKDIAVGMGGDECEINSTDAVGTFYGYSWRAPKSFSEVMSPLLIAYNLITQEKDLQLVIMHRLAAEDKTVEEWELGAQEGDNPDIIPPFDVTREDPKRLPAEVQLSYLDRDLKGEAASQPYRRIGLPLSNTMQVSIPVLLDKDQARRTAKRICYGEAVSSEKHATRLPPSRLDTYESDRLFTTSNGRERTTLITKIIRGNNYEHEIAGARDDPEMFANEDALGGDSGVDVEPVGQADPLALIADIPPLEDADVDTPMLYAGAVRHSKDQTWNTSGIFESTGGTYSIFDLADDETPAGTVVGTVASGPVGVWDDATSITLDLRGGTAPVTSTDDEVLAGNANWWLIGGEVIAFVNVSSSGGGIYVLSRLVRGLMDTAERVAIHSVNETAFRVRPVGPLGKREYALVDVGLVRTYDAALQLDTPDGVEAVTATLNGSTVRPFSGCLPIGTRNLPAANDWTITWTERTRRPLFPIFGSTVWDDAETDEEYVVESWNSTFTVLGFTITHVASGNGSVITVPSEGAPSCVFDAADQPGGGAATIYLRIYQVGDAGLRSKKLETTLTG